MSGTHAPARSAGENGDDAKPWPTPPGRGERTVWYPFYRLSCGCRVTLSDPITLAYCRSHSLAHDCAEAFKRAAPAAYQEWLNETVDRKNGATQ